MSFLLQLGAAVVGDLDKEVADGRRRVEFATQAALQDQGADLQTVWRLDVGASGLANAEALTKTIRMKFYANTGLDPAVVVYSNFPLLQRAFEQAKTITAGGGKFLIIPNPDIWPGGRVRRPRGVPGGGSTSLQTARERFGALRFIPPAKGKAGLIVAETLHSAKTGRFRKIKNYDTQVKYGGGAAATIVVFFVVRKARQEQRLRGRTLRARAERNFASEMQRDFDRYLDQAERGPLALTDRSGE